MKNLAFLAVLITIISSCGRDNDLTGPEPHVNSFPRKVRIYKVSSGSADSLMFSYQFYKNAAGNYFDSIYAEPGFDGYSMLYYDDSSGLYGIKIDKVFQFYYYGLYYDVHGNLTELDITPYGCDGVSPGSEYFFTYNPDGSMESYKRLPRLSRCGGYEDSARYEYRNNDTTIVYSGSNYDPLQADTLIYVNDNLQVSNIPLFSNYRNIIFPSTEIVGGILEFIPFQTKKMPLIKHIRNGNLNGFVLDMVFNYTFNSNKDVSELLIDANFESPYVGNARSIRYKFDY